MIPDRLEVSDILYLMEVLGAHLVLFPTDFQAGPIQDESDKGLWCTIHLLQWG